MIKLYTEVALTQDLPEYGLKKGNTAIAIEHYPMPEGQEEGYSLEGFDTSLKRFEDYFKLAFLYFINLTKEN